MTTSSYHARNARAKAKGFSSASAEYRSRSAWHKARKYGEFSRLTKGLRPNQALAKMWIEAFDEPSGSAYLRKQDAFFNELKRAYAKAWDASWKGKTKSLANQTPRQRALAFKAVADSPEDRRRAGTQINWRDYGREYDQLHGIKG